MRMKQIQNRGHLTDFANWLYVFNISKQTITQYVGAVEAFLRWKKTPFTKDKVKQKEEIVQYKTYLSQQGFAKSIIQKKLSAIRKYYTWIIEIR